MGLPLTDPQGRVYAVPGGSPVTFSAGLGYDVDGRLCVTTTQSPLDVYVGAKRVSQSGALVVDDGMPPARPYDYNAGWPTDKRTGATIRQVDELPVAQSPYVAGVRVGPLGGVYLTTAAPSLLGAGAQAKPSPPQRAARKVPAVQAPRKEST